MGENGRNRFFQAAAPPDEPRSGRVYAAYEVPEPGGEAEARSSKRPDASVSDFDSEPVLLECMDTNWVHALSGTKSFLENFRDVPLSVLELRGYPLYPLPHPNSRQGRSRGTSSAIHPPLAPKRML